MRRIDWAPAGVSIAVGAAIIWRSLSNPNEVMNFGKRLASIFQFSGGSGQTRTEIWQAAIAAIKERPDPRLGRRHLPPRVPQVQAGRVRARRRRLVGGRQRARLPAAAGQPASASPACSCSTASSSGPGCGRSAPCSGARATPRASSWAPSGPPRSATSCSSSSASRSPATRSCCGSRWRSCSCRPRGCVEVKALTLGHRGRRGRPRGRRAGHRLPGGLPCWPTTPTCRRRRRRRLADRTAAALRAVKLNPLNPDLPGRRRARLPR